MQLSYRGIAYNAKSSVTTSSGEIIGQYRGAALRAQRFTVPATHKFAACLQYRGVGAQSSAHGSISSTLASSF
ncbi:DUF4278 domain-containing protein [Leptolyngbya sp. FACHB-261]|uniref:DUF4278 domain-containing protein n=1 Tax=Leptolyngbya sp. FACHB-261 TaxID=2692806 RepID=UPI00168560E3|nr:DUF4278 domain-containing protein [Leptolyngbya sp. FACHB-261]MBD2103990.1 DUF4278 domain-containing protein [Leptolyngbya sp. FACHB-261]